MAVQIFWLIPKRVIYIVYPAGISAEQGKAIQEQIKSVIQAQSRSKLVHVIENVSAMGDAPTMDAAGIASPQQLGYTITLSQNIHAGLLSQTWQQNPRRAKTITDLETAIEFLEQVDETLLFPEPPKQTLIAQIE